MSDPWEKLPYTKEPAVCHHCGQTTPMRVVTEKGISEILYYGGEPASSMWTQWQILKCPLCNKINVFEYYSIADEDVEVFENGRMVTDMHGEPVYESIVHTTVLYPLADKSISKPHTSMPSEIMKDYEEAQLVFPFSARSSAALLRLAIQKLCRHLGEKEKDVNEDIKSLVKKGLPPHIQQALDIVRVVGNEAVHPGEINVRDNPEIAKQLFDLVNEIVDDRIGRVEKQAKIENIYKGLPEKKLDHIRDRDKDAKK